MAFGYALHPEDQQQLDDDLGAFLADSEARAAVLCDIGGNVIVESGGPIECVELVSALVAGSFAATKELAGALGEQEFAALFHQGKDTSIFITSVDEEVLMLVLFTEDTNAGLVKMYAMKTCRKMHSLFQAIMSRDTVDNDDPTRSFVLSKGPIFQDD